MENDSGKTLWFRAKTYGFGWGLPLTWHGWVVFAVYFVLLLLGVVNMYQNFVPIPFPIYFLFITAGFVLICYLKGEKPRWRWGR